MCEVLATISAGLIDSEKVAQVETADGGQETVQVGAEQVRAGRLLASEVGRKDKRVLVELPRETLSGRWRIWVPESSVQ